MAKKIKSVSWQITMTLMKSDYNHYPSMIFYSQINLTMLFDDWVCKMSFNGLRGKPDSTKSISVDISSLKVQLYAEN